MIGERYTLRLPSRHHLSPGQRYLKEGDEVFVAVGGGHYMLAVDSITEDGDLTISGVLLGTPIHKPKTELVFSSLS